MAKLNLDYYTAKDHYSDGDIENTLLEMAREGKSFQDLPEEEVSFPMVISFFRPEREYPELVSVEKNRLGSGDWCRLWGNYRNALSEGLER